MTFNFDPNWNDLIYVVVSWLLGALGVGIPRATPNRIMNKE